MAALQRTFARKYGLRIFLSLHRISVEGVKRERLA